ncbi:MAG TPA: glycosyl transferase, partial [Xanthobacteraceae bacterium]|nr:glycosyl transferase [Xanthobacteraceae bacterium]
GMPVGEIATPYYARLEGSESKLNTWRDGFRILRTIFNLYRGERPLQFFTLLSAVFAALSVVLAVPVIVTFLEQGVVPRLPTAILAMGMMVLAFLSLASGLILDTVTRGRRELKRLAYLSHRAPLGFDRRAD